MSDLTRYQAVSVSTRHSRLVDPNSNTPRRSTQPGVDPNGCEWTGEIPDIVEVIGLQPSDPNCYGYSQSEVAGIRHDGDNGHYRVRQAWMAWATCLDLFSAKQAVVRRPDGKFSPRGEWRRDPYDRRLVTAPPAERVGQVQADVDVAGHTVASHSPQPPVQLRVALHELRYLPQAVKQGFLPDPLTPEFLCVQALREYDGTGRAWFSVTGCVVQDSMAQVLFATLPIGHAMWQVRQLTYTLVQKSPAIGQGTGRDSYHAIRS